MPILTEVMRGLVIMVSLPFTPVAEDRIIAARRYRSSLGPHERQRQLRNPRSLLRRLDRIAVRQQRINAINEPGYKELQERKWERAYGYGRFFKLCLFCFAIGYGGHRVEALLREFWPGAYVVWMGGCNAVIQGINFFWRVMAQSVGAA